MRISYGERLDLAHRLADGVVNVDDLLGSPDLDEEDRRAVMNLGLYIVQGRFDDARRKALGTPQKRALMQLRSLLSAEQVNQLRRTRQFRATMPSGRTYSFSPNTGAVRLCQRFGSRWYRVGSYCMHEEPLDVFPEAGPGLVRVDAIPRADRTIGHLLYLLADEERFLAEANFTAYKPNMGWDSEWMRRRWEMRNGCRLCGERTHRSETCVSRRELGAVLAEEMQALRSQPLTIAAAPVR